MHRRLTSSPKLAVVACLTIAMVSEGGPLRSQQKQGAPQHPPLPRRIVLCLDGTWNSAFDPQTRDTGDQVLKPTNVLKLCRAVLPHDDKTGREQIVYYDTGVGSLAEYGGMSNHLLYLTDRLLGGAFGAGFEGNVEDALTFLVNNYAQGDEVFIFGFSRGAATARAVTHFLDWATGLPVKNDAYYVPVLFRAYVDSKGTKPLSKVLEEIAEQRQLDKRPQVELEKFQLVDVRFLGVWDTVMALGSRFRSTGTSTSEVSKSFFVSDYPAKCVRNARQALAIDEARFDFRPEVYKGAGPGQSLAQRWFAGVHSNVGGAYLHDGLANIPFTWLREEAESEGLVLDPAFVRHYNPFVGANLYDSDSPTYRFLDGIRQRAARGRRPLLGRPESAHLTLDPSVIKRIRAEPAKFPALQGRGYRPQNVLQFLACQSDLDGYLAGIGLDAEHRQLPADVLAQLPSLRRNCGRADVPGTAHRQ
jgi:uncharacterized protein (DUF2235 family)